MTKRNTLPDGLDEIEALVDSLIALTDKEVALLGIITERIVRRLDKMEKLTDKEENLVSIVVNMTLIELKKEPHK